jgi:glucuronate isomerase
MRANGIAERYITGEAPAFDKFMAWAATVPKTLRNPLFHWTHLELERYFGIEELLDEHSAKRIWDRATARLREQPLTTWGILQQFGVRAVCTTDDPGDDLDHHRAMRQSNAPFRMFPTFRPDAALANGNAGEFQRWLNRLEQAAGHSISTLEQLVDALSARHAAFHEVGCRLSDHGLPYCYAMDCEDATAAGAFRRMAAGESAHLTGDDQFRSHLMMHFGRLDARAGWTKQLHLGAIRNNNSRLRKSVGPDGGGDSIGDWTQVGMLGRFLDRLDRENSLPKMIVYNLNPADNYAIAGMLGNFQEGPTPSKLQLGSGWWFLDQADGIRWQLDTLSRTGLLAHFVGMVTDSRSFMSFPRHEYFRRVLCDVIGRDVDAGLLPDSDSLLGPLIQDICFGNAARYLGLEISKGGP